MAGEERNHWFILRKTVAGPVAADYEEIERPQERKR